MQFRHWVTEKWYEHQREVRSWTGEYPAGSAAQYFRKYRWYLKTLYKLEVLEDTNNKQ